MRALERCSRCRHAVSCCVCWCAAAVEVSMRARSLVLLSAIKSTRLAQSTRTRRRSEPPASDRRGTRRHRQRTPVLPPGGRASCVPAAVRRELEPNDWPESADRRLTSDARGAGDRTRHNQHTRRQGQKTTRTSLYPLLASGSPAARVLLARPSLSLSAVCASASVQGGSSGLRSPPHPHQQTPSGVALALEGRRPTSTARAHVGTIWLLQEEPAAKRATG